MTFLGFIACMFAGLGAGVATGFAGLSAAVVISPVLISFLGIPAYDAVGIALASDVLASAASSFTYWRNKNIQIKSGFLMMAAAVAFAFLGSAVALLIHTEFEVLMEYVPVGITLVLGFKFLCFPSQDTTSRIVYSSEGTKLLVSVMCGAFIGFYCGMVGAGGGMVMLIVLTMVLGYDLKSAVGTSVLIMTAISLTGALSRFLISPSFSLTHYWPEMIGCVLFTLVGAVLASVVANRITHRKMNFLTGLMLLIIGVMTLLGGILNWHLG